MIKIWVKDISHANDNFSRPKEEMFNWDKCAMVLSLLQKGAELTHAHIYSLSSTKNNPSS